MTAWLVWQLCPLFDQKSYDLIETVLPTSKHRIGWESMEVVAQHRQDPDRSVTFVIDRLVMGDLIWINPTILHVAGNEVRWI